jgi:nitroreductase
LKIANVFYIIISGNIYQNLIGGINDRMKEIERRRSVRKYKDKNVEDEKIIQILESARLAPSGSNTQPWHFIIVKSDSARQTLAAASHSQKWMVTAPVFIVCVADISCRLDEKVTLDENSPQEELKQIIRDTSISTGYMLLEADNLGLSTCWIGWFKQTEIKSILKIPDDKYVVGIILVGYADETPKARPRKKLEDIIHYENW